MVKLQGKNRKFTNKKNENFLKSFKKEIHEKNWTSLRGKNSKFAVKMFMKKTGNFVTKNKQIYEKEMAKI